MRDGAYIATEPIADTTRRRDRRADGRPRGRRPVPQDARRDRRRGPRGRAASAAPGVFHDVSFTVRAGEIVGLAGLVGAGRSEIARAVFGVDPYDSGTVTHRRHAASPAHSPAAAIRRRHGASSPRTAASRASCTEASVARNVAGVIRRSLTEGRPAHLRAPRTAAAGTWAGRLEVKTSALDMTPPP